jgi:hypothetical protein
MVRSKVHHNQWTEPIVQFGVLQNPLKNWTEPNLTIPTPNRSKICNFSPPKYCTISINSTRHTSDSQALVLCRIGPMCDQAGKLKNGSKIGCFTDHFSSSRPDWAQKSLKAAYSGVVECRNFCSVTVTGHLCRSVELVQRVTVTQVCRIERNGTVVSHAG